MKKQKQNYEAIPSKNGRTCRYYLKPEQEQFINSEAVVLDKSPSEFLREVIDIHKKIIFLIQKNNGGKTKD